MDAAASARLLRPVKRVLVAPDAGGPIVSLGLILFFRSTIVFNVEYDRWDSRRAQAAETDQPF